MSHKSPKIETLLAGFGDLPGFNRHYVGFFRCFNAQLYYEAHLFALALANFEAYPMRHGGIDLDVIRKICREHRQAILDSGETVNPWSPEKAPQLALPSMELG
jgi:hypothetical protein